MTGRDRQTVADMAVEHIGSADGVFAIVRHNNIAIDADVAGMELVDEPVVNRRTKEYIATSGVSPAGMYDLEDDVLTTDDGLINVVTESGETIIQ